MNPRPKLATLSPTMHAGHVAAPAIELLPVLAGSPDRPDVLRRWCRVRQLAPLFTKPFVFALLRDGKIDAKKVGGVLLIDVASVERLIASAESWTGKRK